MRNQAQYPELRDKFLKDLGYYELAKEIGFNRLPSRVVGTVGGMVNRYFVSLAEDAIKKGDTGVYSAITPSAQHSLDEFKNSDKYDELNPTINNLN